MKHFLLSIFFILCAGTVGGFAQDKDSLYLRASEAYGKADYDTAIASFEKIIEISEEPTSEMYYNLAGAFFKSGNLGKAVLNYERAYRLNPADSDTKFNLKLLSTRIEDKIAPSPSVVVGSYIDSVTHWFTLRTWVVLSILFFAVFAGLVLLYFLGDRRGHRLGGFYGALFSLLFSVFCLVFAFKSNAFILDTSEAVLTAPVSTLKSSPDSSAKDVAVLHSGLKVRATQRVADFYEITLADGVVGWISVDALEFVNPGF